MKELLKSNFDKDYELTKNLIKKLRYHNVCKKSTT